MEQSEAKSVVDLARIHIVINLIALEIIYMNNTCPNFYGGCAATYQNRVADDLRLCYAYPHSIYLFRCRKWKSPSRVWVYGLWMVMAYGAASWSLLISHLLSLFTNAKYMFGKLKCAFVPHYYYPSHARFCRLLLHRPFMHCEQFFCASVQRDPGRVRTRAKFILVQRVNNFGKAWTWFMLL